MKKILLCILLMSTSCISKLSAIERIYEKINITFKRTNNHISNGSKTQPLQLSAFWENNTLVINAEKYFGEMEVEIIKNATDLICNESYFISDSQVTSPSISISDEGNYTLFITLDDDIYEGSFKL